MNWSSCGSYLVVGLAALLPRVFALGLFLTDDEANFWIKRSHAFLEAITAGNWAGTALSTHPGVTTMWLGSLGLLLRETLLGWGVLPGVDFPMALTFFRLPPVLVHVGGVLLGLWMLRKVLPAHLAFLGALLWATDPFFVGYSRLLHVDALAGTFATLSLLAACCALTRNAFPWWRGSRSTGDGWGRGGWRRPAAASLPGADGAGLPTEPFAALRPGASPWLWLGLSGVFAGLAVLSKSPAIVLVPAVALSIWLVGRRQAHWPGSAVRTVILGCMVWGLVAAATVFALWPALWVSPVRAFEELRTGVAVEGAQPHMTGNFFLGERVEAPGLAYYPAALALRLTPWGLVGLLLLPLAWRGAFAERDPRPVLAALAGFVVLFVVAMSVFPKKFDRYLIPTALALSILAAAGLLALVRMGAGAEWRRRVLITVVGALAFVNLAWWHPYSLVAYNQLLGGAPAGAQTFRMGWSEGLEQVASWLNAQPDITGVAVTAERGTSLNPYLRRGAQADFPRNGQLHRENGYVVVYIAQVQGGPPPPPFDRFYGRVPPLYTVRIKGVDYAWVYQVPPPLTYERHAVFGEALLLRGYDQAQTAQAGGTLLLRLHWMAQAKPEADYWLFAHLINQDGQRVTQLDQPYPTSQWEPGRHYAVDLPLALPPELPPGSYKLLVGLYDPATGQRLPLGESTAADPRLSGAAALDLMMVWVTSPTPPHRAQRREVCRGHLTPDPIARG